MAWRAPEWLVRSVIQSESGNNPFAVSRTGARGLMQIQPDTAASPGFGVKPFQGDDLFDEGENVRFGTDYLSAMLERYAGDPEAALVAYNAGPGNADKFVAAGKDYTVLPKPQETKPYVESVLGRAPKEGTDMPTVPTATPLPTAEAPRVAPLNLPPGSSDRRKALAQSLLKSSQQLGGNTQGNPLALWGAIAQNISGNYLANRDETAGGERRKALAEAITNASDPGQLISTLMASGDPELIKMAVKQRMQGDRPPKVYTLTVGKDKYGRAIQRDFEWDEQEGRFKPLDVASTSTERGAAPLPGTSAQTPPQQGDSASDGPVIRDIPDNEDGRAAAAGDAQTQPEAGSIPEGMEAGPLADKSRIGEGYIHKKAPGGRYLWQRQDDGSYEPVLESEAAEKKRAALGVEKQKNKPKIWRSIQSMEDTHNIVQEDIDRAINNYLETGEWPETGIFAYLSYVPGTSAYDLSQLLTTIKSNIGFDKLQQMRENSPTGGALGQVSNLEIKNLQAVLGSMDQFQSNDQLLRNLRRLSETLQRNRKRRREAFEKDFGEPPDIETGDDTSTDEAGGEQTSGRNAVLQKARDAIEAGADRKAVIQRLRDAGIDPEGL